MLEKYVGGHKRNSTGELHTVSDGVDHSDNQLILYAVSTIALYDVSHGVEVEAITMTLSGVRIIVESGIRY